MEILSGNAITDHHIRKEYENILNRFRINSIAIKQDRDILNSKPISKYSIEHDVVVSCDSLKNEIDIGSTLYIERNSYKCEKCNYICNCQSSYNDHLRNHNNDHVQEKIIECDKFDKTFAQELKITKKAPKRVRVNKNLYECNICHKKFSFACHHKIHMRKHTGEKPYECNVCHKKLKSAYNRMIHVRLHTRENLFECNICLKGFPLPNALRRHMLIHTGEKPFECNICHKTFTYKCNRMLHVKKCKGQEVFKCDFCPKIYTGLSACSAHMRVHTRKKL